MNNGSALVSIVSPAWNSSKFIGETIESVQQQTYSNWELLVIDDASTDDTVDVVSSYCIKDNRIKCIKLPKNMGPGMARQKGIELARGQFIAFLDSDDLWYPQKLQKQISFMKNFGCAFTCTAYEQIDEEGLLIGKIIVPPEKSDYNRVLLDCPVGNSTVIYDCKKLGKCYAPNINNREDYGLWLKILKREKFVFGIREVLTKYRIRRNSQSRNKIKLLWYQWILYRDFEHLSFFRSVFHVCYWIAIKLLRIK